MNSSNNNIVDGLACVAPGDEWRFWVCLPVHSSTGLNLRFPGFWLIVAVFLLISSPFLLGQLDEIVPNCSLSIWLVQGFPTLASELRSDISSPPSSFTFCLIAISSWTDLLFRRLHNIGSSFLCPHGSRCVQDGTTSTKTDMVGNGKSSKMKKSGSNLDSYTHNGNGTLQCSLSSLSSCGSNVK
eukprot:scaffold132929_cov72-Attheya_sp.AAC.3